GGGAAGLDAMVLQDETAGGAGDCGGGEWRNTNPPRELAGGLFSLDEEHPRVADFAATLVGTPDSCVALPRKWAHHRGERDASGLWNVWIEEPGARPGCAGYLV